MTAPAEEIDYTKQRRMVSALLDRGRFPHAARSVRVVETHISWVLLAGRYAYKIKKAVDLGFLDFTRLDARRFYCTEEIRLNRRLAPGIYLDVIGIGGPLDNPQLGAQPAIEYAVRMRRFPVSRQLDHLLKRGKLAPQHMDRLAATVAAFHRSLPPAEKDTAFGTAATIRAAAMQNFEQLLSLLAAQADCDVVAAIRQATGQEYAACEQRFEQRHAQGYIRECHGDLHLGNIVLIRDEPVPFDGIDFNAALRWIDVVDEAAFLMMDLLHSRRADLAWRFLNGWLEATGDYDGMRVLHFYLAYRATVRAKISAIRAFQPDVKPPQQRKELSACRSYLALAADCLARKPPALIIMHGLPGSGKSVFAEAALERLHAIRIRSDVERKRLFGLQPLEESRSPPGGGIYTADATKRTYARLRDLAHALLESGFTVIVDAAFPMQAERAPFQQLAHDMAVPFVIVHMQASEATLEARIAKRRSDASEADVEVLQQVMAVQQPLLSHELACTVGFPNDTEYGGIPAAAEGWGRLEELLATQVR